MTYTYVYIIIILIENSAGIIRTKHVNNLRWTSIISKLEKSLDNIYIKCVLIFAINFIPLTCHLVVLETRENCGYRWQFVRIPFFLLCGFSPVVVNHCTQKKNAKKVSCLLPIKVESVAIQILWVRISSGLPWKYFRPCKWKICAWTFFKPSMPKISNQVRDTPPP